MLPPLASSLSIRCRGPTPGGLQGRGAQDSGFWQNSASSTHKYLSGGGDGELGSQADESLGIQV